MALYNGIVLYINLKINFSCFISLVGNVKSDILPYGARTVTRNHINKVCVLCTQGEHFLLKYNFCLSAWRYGYKEPVFIPDRIVVIIYSVV